MDEGTHLAVHREGNRAEYQHPSVVCVHGRQGQ